MKMMITLLLALSIATNCLKLKNTADPWVALSTSTEKKWDCAKYTLTVKCNGKEAKLDVSKRIGWDAKGFTYGKDAKDLGKAPELKCDDTKIDISAKHTSGLVWAGIADRYVCFDGKVRSKAGFLSASCKDTKVENAVVKATCNGKAFTCPLTQLHHDGTKLSFKATGASLATLTTPAYSISGTVLTVTSGTGATAKTFTIDLNLALRVAGDKCEIRN